MIKIIEIKELTELESLKLSLEYSISRKHKNSLIERIAKLEGNSIGIKTLGNKPRRSKKVDSDQQSFL